ncbi:hypothetical protein [Pseudodesulfovibrio sp. zrk46]|uniref:hypothetical protein n=1 Tax=Pseudodesulfovibrio sp. zrk46 TaxID=2725288 RepID=UPI001448D42F|nr:hypothetical protein [Pseudodesulfovibrio sp. zrk46]QJB55237.1 hypothetical protein HFN16_01945 [Pseudodesulfovibrio sp. zrk46]
MKNMLIHLALIGIMLQAGCSIAQVDHKESTLPFGSSVKLAISQQTLNPEAGTDAPVVGIDGRYAQKVAEKYNEGPRTEAKDGQSISGLIVESK